MLIADNGAGIRFLWEDDLYLHGMAAEVGGLWMRMGKDRERLPNLTDPATLGCLLALVREAWSNKIVIRVGNGWGEVETDAECWAINTSDFASILLAALEAAP